MAGEDGGEAIDIRVIRRVWPVRAGSSLIAGMARIILIEDDGDLRAALARVLRDAGHVVEDVAGGNAALRLADDVPPDLIITDIFMPDGDGVETILALKNRDRGVPVIAISADARYLHHAKVFGAVSTLIKPFGKGRLLSAVEHALAPPLTGGSAA